MNSTHNIKPPQAHQGYLRTAAAAAAAYLDIGKSTLERKRFEGNGPPFRILGAKIVVYAISDLDAWASARMFCSTSAKAA